MVIFLSEKCWNCLHQSQEYQNDQSLLTISWKNTTESLTLCSNRHANSICCSITEISLSKWFSLAVFIDVKVVMARLQILAKRRKWNPWIVSMTNTINYILKAEKIFQSKEWKIPTRFSKFWVALKPWHYYLLELWNKRKHCIVKEWLWLYTSCKFTFPG